MLKILLISLVMALFSTSAMALSEKEYQQMLKSSAEFRNADKLLNDAWKKVNRNLDKQNKKYLLQMQREWIKTGRDDSADEYMLMGYTKDCAYAKATRRWVSNLEVFNYNAQLPIEDQEAGRVKADDAFWDEDDENIPPHCLAE